MTVKEISGAVGKDERTVQRWVKDVSDKMSSINDKMSSSTSTYPANYTLAEVIEIIRTGMGDGPAGVFAENANKPKAPKTQSISAEMLKQTRLAIKDDLITKAEARAILGVEIITRPVPVVENLGRISKQAYAVEMKVRQSQQQKLLIQDQQKELDL